MHLAPDQMCSIKHTFLKVRSDGTSTIKCCFQVQGTRLLSVMSEEDVQEGEVRLPPPVTAEARDISSTAAAVAAVFPTKVRSVIRSDQRNSSWKERCANNASADDTVTSANSLAENTLSNELHHTLNARHDVFAGSDAGEDTGVDSLSSQLEDLSDLDSVDALHSPVRHGNQTKKQKRVPKKASAVDEWLSVAQDAHRHGNLSHSADYPAAATPAAASETTLDWRPVHPPVHIQHLSGAPRAPMLGCPLKKSTSKKYAARTNAVSPVNCLAPGTTSAPPHPDKLTYLQAENERVMQECQLFSTFCQGQVVLMTKLNTICSFEMEFNADGKVTSIVLNYIT